MELGTESHRIQFIIDRDGLEAAVAFSKQTMIIYRRHILDKRRKMVYNNRQTSEYLDFLSSYFSFRRFYFENRV